MYEYLKEARFNEGNENLTVRLIYLEFLDFVDAFVCEFTNKNHTEYPKSIVLSELFIEGEFFFFLSCY
jgi:hypothetical protein